MSVASYQVRGRVSVPALALATSVSFAGVLVMLMASAFGWGRVVVAAGVALVALSIAFVVAVVSRARRSNVTATLNDDAFVLVSSGAQVALPWRDVRQVSMAANTLIVREVGGQEVKVVAPPGAAPQELDALAAAMVAKLDASRGYHNL